MSTREDDEAISSQIYEEQDLFFDDESLDQPDEGDEEDLPTDQLLASLAAATSSSNGSKYQFSDDDTLRNRLAGPSTNKAGMDCVDKNKVNQIIYEASKGSAFFENERKHDAAVTKRIEAMLARYEKIKHLDLSLETQVVDNMIRDMEAERDLTQVICHVDMDAFYASVEELENPELKTVPMAVGSVSMLCTSNYEARKYGVRSGMPGYIALKLCPHLKIVPLHFPKYRAASSKVREIFAKYDPHFCPMSLDEAYLNLTDYLSKHDISPPDLVQQIRNEIFEETKLTASAGIAANKFLSKVCSDMNKPNGQFYLANDRKAIMDFVKDLKVRKVPGVGRVTERVLEALDVKTCGDIFTRRAVLYRLLSPISFKFMLRCYLGLGSTSVKAESSRKSISVERTFRAISTREQLMAKVDELSQLLAQDLEPKKIKGKTVGIKIKLTSFEVRVRAKTLPYYVYKASDIARVAKELVAKEMPVSLRLMGIKLSSLKQTSDNDEGVKRFFTAFTNSIPAKRLDPSEQGGKEEEKKKEEEEEEEERRTDAKRHKPEPKTQDNLSCPICNRVMRNMDNAQLNRHVDECLNRDTVKSIVSSLSSSNSSSSNKNSTTISASKNPTESGRSLLDYYSCSSGSNCK